MRQDQSVLIVGAGPTGLAMAIECKRAGIPVRIIDKSEQPAQHSQALGVQARTLEQFERYGIADEAVARGRKLRHGALVSEQKTIVDFDFGFVPGRYPFVLFLPQNETERLLTAHLRSLGGEVERGTELLSFRNEKDGVEVQLRHYSGAPQTFAARWLIGCDGAHSVVRRDLQVPFEGDTVGLDFFLGDLELEGPDVPGEELRVHSEHGNVVFIGRLDDKLHRVIVVLHPEPEARPLDHQPTLADFQAAIDRIGARIAVRSSAWATPFHINQRKAKQYRVESTFLAGDASHIHSPVAGQGMNTGIQDAANLGWKIVAVAVGAGLELLDALKDGRPLALAIGIEDVQKVHARAPRANVVELRGVNAILGTEMESPEASPVGELRGRHAVSAEFPESSGVGVAAAARAFMPIGLLTPEITQLFGSENRVAVIRPDGYLGFRGSISDLARLDDYARLTGLA